jgi:glycosyltransferase involved in cell wall biosynthesis
MRILILTRYASLGASSRLRSLQYLPWIVHAGYTCKISPFIDNKQLQHYYQTGSYTRLDILIIYLRRIKSLLKVSQFDLVWIEKEALPWLPVWFERFLLQSTPYVLDYDDALFHNYDRHLSPWVRRFYGKRIDTLMAGAKLVTVCNDYLAKRAQDAGAQWIELIPTVVDFENYSSKDYSPSSEPYKLPTIVWIGSPSTMKFLTLLHKPLKELSQHFQFKFRVIAGTSPEIPGVDVEFIPWSEGTESISIQNCDIGVMPLVNDAWERGKCGYKLIQYMACGLPVVATPISINCQLVSEGDNGYLAKTDSEWVIALSKLLADAALRQRMGEVGRKQVKAKYCIQQTAPKLIKLLQKVAQ